MSMLILTVFMSKPSLPKSSYVIYFSSCGMIYF